MCVCVCAAADVLRGRDKASGTLPRQTWPGLVVPERSNVCHCPDSFCTRLPSAPAQHQHGRVGERWESASFPEMTGPYSECPIRLHRDALNTPWGFRLQGGKDFKVPLSVQRLHRGDILVAIDNYDATNLTHKQAQDIIKNAGGSLSIRLRRGVGYAEAPKPLTFGPPVIAGTPASSSQEGTCEGTGQRFPPIWDSDIQDIAPLKVNNGGGCVFYFPPPAYRLTSVILDHVSSNTVGDPKRLARVIIEADRRSEGLGFSIWWMISPRTEPAFIIADMLTKKIGRYRLGLILDSLSIYTQYRTRPLESIAPKPAPPIGAFSPKTGTGMQNKFGIDYSGGQYNRSAGNPPPGSMLQKVNASLNQSIWSHEDNQEQDYESKPIGEIKKIFSQGSPNQHMPAFAQTGSSYKPARRQPWRKPHTDGTALQEPGWSPRSNKPVQAPFRVPQSAPASIPVNRLSPQQHYQQPQQQRGNRHEKPPWSGSLRSSGGPKPWEIHAGEHLVPGGGEVHVPTGPSSIPRQAPQSATFHPQQQQQQQQPPQHHQQPMTSPNVQPHSPRVQNVHYGPGGPQYQQLSPRAADPDTAKVVHAQYNSPLGLYSRENVQAALEGQTAGKPGDGTMQVSGGGPKKTFNPAQSDVYRLLQEEQEIAGQRHQQQQHAAQAEQSARYQEQQPGQEMHYVGYVDPSTKSPSMMALEAHVMDEGTSDF
ncbi:hypothetical protein LSH36_67g03008 [Paralvinella palmiformis]|uniref:PDZ domain-containing protein n=1 Tax=Paralvinella palmiformis TaxID=53620 RepID=A0AAD9K3I6_9ANNE|nr:hypothetical protein LSH36_67g03008 [Paralvinella palmiformis]